MGSSCSKCDEYTSNIILLKFEIEKYKCQIDILENDVERLNDRLNIYYNLCRYHKI